MADPRKLIEQFKSLQAERNQTIESTWRDCYNNSIPIRGVALNTNTTGYGQSGNVSQSNQKKSILYDTTAAEAVDQLGAFILSGAVPANARWFDFGIADDPDYKNPWLDEVADIVWRKIHAGNFDASSFECLQDIIIAGMFCQYITLTDENDLLFETWALGSSYFAASKAGGAIDICYRNYKLTPAQAVDRFPDKMSAQVVKRSTEVDANKPTVDMLLAIYPRKGKPGVTPETYPFAACHVDIGAGLLVDESGYQEFPCAIPRWAVIPESVYATGPIYKALPDVKMANQLKQMILLNGEMAAVGMYKAVDDGVINPAAITVGPRKVMIVSDINNFQSIGPAGDFNVSELLLQQIQGQIQKALMIDQLAIPQNSTTTATEINVRMELLRQRVAPVFGRLQAEWLQRVVERCFGLLFRANLLPPLPDELKDQQLHIRYVSPLARAQRLSEVTAIDQFEISLANLMQFKPGVADVYDWDEGQREKSYLLGVPQKLMVSPTKVKEIQAARAKQQAEQQQALIAAQSQQGAQ